MLIYFIQDTDQPAFFAYPIVSVCIDGRWVGASTNASYFAVTVEPGLHDLCAEAQSPFPAPDPEFDHLVAKPGEVYFFRVRLFLADTAIEYSSLAPLPGNDAIDLIAAYPQATAYFPSEIAPITIRSSATARGQSAPGAGLALNAQPAKIVRDHINEKPAPRHPIPRSPAPPREHPDSGKPPNDHNGTSVGSTATKGASRAGTSAASSTEASGSRRTQ